MKTPGLLLTAGTAALILLLGCKSGGATGPEEPGGISFNEASVATVRIGNQTWMAENLNITLDLGGRPIDAIAYNNDPGLAAVYGRLYTWDGAMQACPPGWHLPSIEEWQELFDFLGGIDVAGGKMKTVDRWDPPNTGASNSSGFNALPAGGGDGSVFDSLGWATHFWSSTSDGANARMPSLMNTMENTYVLNVSRTMRASVRYIRN